MTCFAGQIGSVVSACDMMLLRRVVEMLPRYTYRFSNEIALHEGMAEVLTGAGIQFEREVVAGPKDRFDFLLPSGIVIEAKVNGSLSRALQQVDRYAQRNDVSAIVIVSTRFWGRARAGAELRGKPLRLVRVGGSAF